MNEAHIKLDKVPTFLKKQKKSVLHSSFSIRGRFTRFFRHREIIYYTNKYKKSCLRKFIRYAISLQRPTMILLASGIYKSRRHCWFSNYSYSQFDGLKILNRK